MCIHCVLSYWQGKQLQAGRWTGSSVCPMHLGQCSNRTRFDKWTPNVAVQTELAASCLLVPAKCLPDNSPYARRFCRPLRSCATEYSVLRGEIVHRKLTARPRFVTRKAIVSSNWPQRSKMSFRTYSVHWTQHITVPVYEKCRCQLMCLNKILRH
jgi:hypothetical protein